MFLKMVTKCFVRRIFSSHYCNLAKLKELMDDNLLIAVHHNFGAQMSVALCSIQFSSV